MPAVLSPAPLFRALLALTVSAAVLLPQTSLADTMALPPLEQWHREAVTDPAFSAWVPQTGGLLRVGAGRLAWPQSPTAEIFAMNTASGTPEHVHDVVLEIERPDPQLIEVRLGALQPGLYRIVAPLVEHDGSGSSTTPAGWAAPSFTVVPSEAATLDAASLTDGTWTTSSEEHPPVSVGLPEGTTAATVNVSWLPSGREPGGFDVLGTLYDVHVTTDPPGGAVRLCFTYTQEQLEAASITEPELRLHHVLDGVPQDITLTGYPSGGKLCGETTTFSPFFLGRVTPTVVEPDRTLPPLPEQARNPEGTPARGRHGGQARAAQVRGR